MRLLFLALDVDLRRRTGDAIHVAELATNLAGLGHSVDLVVEGGNLANVVGALRVHSVPTARAGDVTHVLLDGRPEVIYERRLTPKIAYRCARRLGVPYCVEVNGVPDLERALLRGGKGKTSPLQRTARRFLLRRAHQIVTVSESLRSAVIDGYGVQASRVHVVPNGVNTDLFHPLERDEACHAVGIPSDCYILGFVGNLTVWQGVDRLLRVLALVVRGRHDVSALIVGDGPERAALERLSADLGLREYVRFLGFVPYEEVPQFIAAFDIAFALRPALLPGSPLKVREYMACARPVLASKGTQYDFGIVEEAGAGVLVDPTDLGAAAEAVERMLDDPGLRASMGSRGRAFVEQRASWNRVARRVAEVCALAVDE